MGSESSDKSPYWSIFPGRLEAILGEQGIRQNVFAEMLGVEPTTINSWIKERKQPSATRLFEMADLLQVSLDDLIGRTPPKRKAPGGRARTRTAPAKAAKKRPR